MDVNTGVLEELHASISNWQRKQARSNEENWEYNKFEKALDEYEDSLSYAQNKFGMTPIGEGRDRITFTSGKTVSSKIDVVVKMSKSDGGQQNMDEVELYNMLEKDIEENSDKNVNEFIAPILKYDNSYRWIIQQRASQGSPPGASKTVIEKLENIGWTCSDIRPDNVGLIKNEPVLIDLGLGLRKI